MPVMRRVIIAHNGERLTMRAVIMLAFIAHFAAMPLATMAAEAETPAAPERSLDLALNATSPVDNTCRLSFVVKNGMAADIETLSVDIAVFGESNAVTSMVRFDFGVLIDGKTRVRQFDIADTPCEAIGFLLVNDVRACEGEGIAALDCLRAMRVTSGVDIPLRL